MIDLEGSEDTMTNFFRSFSGRDFTTKDIELIKWARKTYPTLSRTEYIGTVCELIEWTTPSGTAKIDSCGKFLGILEKEGLIDLPPTRTVAEKTTKKMIEIEVNDEEVTGNISELDEIRLEIAYAGNELKRWRAYVEKYHMLGDRQAFGSRLQYFIKCGERELGCMQFSGSSWALEARDKWIGWDVEDRKKRLNLIVNNSRFLLFPWIKVKNLASYVLSMAINQISNDWIREYCYAPVLLETFVDTKYYQGTSYIAANWTNLGLTKGCGRNDYKHEKALSPKMIFVYPLKGDFRKYLTGEKIYKVVEYK
jgi:Domain of unknown function (DUF4338)